MSYILDALKKAERERGIAQVPTLTTVHDLRKMTRVRPWAVSGVFMLCLVAVLWFLLPARRTGVGPMPSPVKEPNRVANQSGVEQIQESTVVDAASSSLQKKPLAVLPRESVTNAQDAAVRRSVVNESRLNRSTQAALAPRQSTAEQAPPQPKPKAGGSNLEEGSPAPGPTQSKPASLKEAMARMTMSILSYSDAKAERLVFINGRKYIEGDHVDGEYLLESITPEGAVLSYAGERGILRPGPK